MTEEDEQPEIKKSSFVPNLLTAVALFFVITLLRVFLDWATLDNGVVRISTLSKIKEKNFVTLDIENFSRQIQDGLIFSAPSSLALTEADSVPPVQVERILDSLGTNQTIRIKISGLQPRALTRVILPFASVPTNLADKVVLLVNGADKKFGSEYGSNIENPIVGILKAGAVGGIITSLLYFAMLLWFEKRSEAESAKIKADLKETRIKLDKGMQGIADILKSVERDRDSTRKMRIVLYARLSDMGRELGFWRDTIRKMLYSESRKNKDSDKLFSEVTEVLKTYKARESEPDFDDIKCYAGLLQPHDELTASIRRGGEESGPKA